MTLPIDPESIPNRVDDHTTDEGREYFVSLMRGEEGSIDESGRQTVLRKLSEMPKKKQKPRAILKAIGKGEQAMPAVVPTEAIANIIFDSDGDDARRTAGALLRSKPTLDELPYTDKDDKTGTFRGPHNYSKLPLLFIRFNHPDLLQDWIRSGGDVRDTELQRAAKAAGFGTDCLKIILNELDVSPSQLVRAMLNYAQGTYRRLVYTTDEGWTQRREFQENPGEVIDILQKHGLSWDEDCWKIEQIDSSEGFHPFVSLVHKMDRDVYRYTYSNKKRDGVDLIEESERVFEPLVERALQAGGELSGDDYDQLYRFVAFADNPHLSSDISQPHREQVVELLQQTSYQPPIDEAAQLVESTSDERYLKAALGERALKGVRARSQSTQTA